MGMSSRQAPGSVGFRRETLCTREVRLASRHGTVASATQEWVHVDSSLRPCRAPAELSAAFPVRHEGEPIELPRFEALSGPEHVFEFDSWFTWMDPLDHVNHPKYVDFCDEAIARVIAPAGLRPVELRPIAETLTFHRGLSAPNKIRATAQLVGRAGAAIVLKHVISTGETTCARGITVRKMIDRQKSQSEISKTTINEAEPTQLVDIWRAT